MKTILKIALIVLILAVTVVTTARADPGGVVAMTTDIELPPGQLIQVMALDDGTALILTLYRITPTSMQAIGVQTPYGAPELIVFGIEEVPQSIQISACGHFVHIVANWQNGRMMYSRVELAAQVASCKEYVTYFPVMQGE